MMVPRIPLILFSALVLFPAAYWLNRGPGTAFPAAVAILAWAAIVLWDALAGRGPIRALQIGIAQVIRMTAERPGRIDLTLRKPTAMKSTLRLGLALPQTIQSDQTDLIVRLQSDQEAYKVSWPCMPLQRGRFALTRGHVECSSWLGLWAFRRRFDLDSELRAYPNLTRGGHDLAGLFRRSELGVHTRRQVGKGREFEQLRDYLAGDNFEDIDWKATARRRNPVTRVFQVEQAQEIYVILDASRLSTRPAAFLTERRRNQRGPDAATAPTTGGGATIFDRYVTASLVMAIVAEQVADRYGLLIFSDKPDCYIKSGRGHAHYNACRETLYDRRAGLVSPDFDELFTFVGTHIRKRALLVFLTSLDDPVLAGSFEQAMAIAGRRHIVMVNMFRPPGAHPLFSNANIRESRGIYQHLAGHTVWESLNETQRRLRRRGAEFELLDQSQLCSQLVRQYLDVKQRQVL
jgi:uncharacterized protein (DUF58 family)